MTNLALIACIFIAAVLYSSVGHGGGPPAHALKHMAAGQAHAGGKAEGGTGASGS